MSTESFNIFREIELDGSVLVIPAMKYLKKMLDEDIPTFLGKYNYKDTKGIWQNQVKFVLAHDKEFAIGYETVNVFKDYWFHCVLYQSSEGIWYRVHIEHVICTNCLWTGNIANSGIMDLYFACPDIWKAFHRGYNAAILGCPICSKKLSRPAIWVDTVDWEVAPCVPPGYP